MHTFKHITITWKLLTLNERNIYIGQCKNSDDGAVSSTVQAQLRNQNHKEIVMNGKKIKRRNIPKAYNK